MNRLTLTLAAIVVLLVMATGATVSGYIGTTSTAPNSFATVADWTAPTVSAAVVAKAAGGDSGYVKPGGSYYVYDNATDAGNPAAGFGSVTATVSALTTTPTTSATTVGTWTVDGVVYGRRSAALTVKTPLTNGAYAFGTVALDAASPANSRTQSFSATVDGTAPVASAIHTTNVAGGTVGRPERGDTVIYTASEPLDVGSILPGWSGAAVNVQAAIYDDTSTGLDELLVGPLGATSLADALPLGIFGLGREDYVAPGAVVYFGESGTPTTLTRSGTAITLTLGTASGGTATTAASTGATRWTPDSDATDRAGNAMSTTAVTFTSKAF